MESETVDEIPAPIAEMMRDDEIENMQNRDGWAVGTVVLLDNNSVEASRIEDAWIELFNGEGRAGEFGGVRFMAIDDNGEYGEAYAYASRQHLFGSEPGWYVAEWNDGEPQYGRGAP